jgi:anti-sigma-K factor RskA
MEVWTGMSEVHVVDLLPGYALEILDEEEMLEVARHLSHCVPCTRELETYLETTNQLAYSVPEHIPAPELRAKVLRSVEHAARQAASPVNDIAKMSVWERVWSLFGPQAGLALGVLAFLLVLFLGINNYMLWQRVNDLEARVPGNNVQIVRLDGTTSAPQSVGYMIVFKNNHYGSLTVENAPVLDATQQYQVWLIKNGERTNGGVFSVNDSGYGVLQVYSKQPLETYDSFGITIEPAGGSPAPTGERILGGGL